MFAGYSSQLLRRPQYFAGGLTRKYCNNHITRIPFHMNKSLFKGRLRSVSMLAQKENRPLRQNRVQTNAKMMYALKRQDPEAQFNEGSDLKTLFKQFNNLPNMITSFRILSTPIVSYFLYHQDYKLFISLFLVSSLSDFLDGFIARKYNLQTKLGSILDPLADKLLIMSTVISMSLIGGPEIIPGWLSAGIIFKDLLLIAKTAVEYGKIKGLGVITNIQPTFVSKFNTLLQLIYIGPLSFWMIYQRENDESEETNGGKEKVDKKKVESWFEFSGYIVGVTTLLSAMSYIGPLWLRKFLL